MHTTTSRRSISRTVTATVATGAAVVIAFGTVACGTDTGKEPVPAAPGAIGNVAPFHSSADSIDKGPRNSKFHTSPDGTEHQQKIDEWRGYGYPSYAD